MNANELADELERPNNWQQENNFTRQAATMLRQQQSEIEALKNAKRFIQNFAEEQHKRAEALESELDRAVELYTDKAIENEALIKKLYFKDYYEELPDTPVVLLRKVQEK